MRLRSPMNIAKATLKIAPDSDQNRTSSPSAMRREVNDVGEQNGHFLKLVGDDRVRVLH